MKKTLSLLLSGMALAASAGAARPPFRSTAMRSASMRSTPPPGPASKPAGKSCRKAARGCCRPSACRPTPPGTTRNRPAAPAPPVTRSAEYNSNGWTASLTQPLFRWQNWVAYKQGELSVARRRGAVRRSQAGLDRACGPGLFRCAAGTGTLCHRRARRRPPSPSNSSRPSATSKSARRPSPIPMRRRRATTWPWRPEIAAQNDLTVKRQALRVVIGKEPDGLKTLKPGVLIGRAAARRHRPNGRKRRKPATCRWPRLRARWRSPARRSSKQRAGHYPTLDLVATHGKSGSRLQLADWRSACDSKSSHHRPATGGAHLRRRRGGIEGPRSGRAARKGARRSR